MTVQASRAVADALRGHAPATPESQAVTRLAHDAGALIHALHHDTTDPTLSTWFTVDVPETSSATGVAEQLRRSPGVVAAFVKPPEALP